MKVAVFAISVLMLASGATASFAASSCSGDFRLVDGGWVSDPDCQRNVARSIAESEGRQISRHPMNDRQETRAEFCAGNENIGTDVYCAPFKD
jgi:hypothetical protein